MDRLHRRLEVLVRDWVRALYPTVLKVKQHCTVRRDRKAMPPGLVRRAPTSAAVGRSRSDDQACLPRCPERGDGPGRYRRIGAQQSPVEVGGDHADPRGVKRHAVMESMPPGRGATRRERRSNRRPADDSRAVRR